jgi:SnoaL-like domain
MHEDKQMLIDATIKMMVFTDEKRWQDLKDLFANPVVIDYTSLVGG